MAQSSKAAKRERQRQNRAVKLEQQAAVEKRQKFWRSARGFIVILVPIAALFVFFALRGGGDDSSDSSSDKSSPSVEVTTKESLPAPSGVTIDPAKTYTARVETTEGDFTITLDAKNAPTSANNFVYLTKAGYYDASSIFRVATYVFQTGSPTNEAAGSPGYKVQAELPSGPYELGSVAWAKTSSDAPGTAGSQFFVITDADYAAKLPTEYGIIGKVTSGQKVLQKIAALAPKSGDGTPTQDVSIIKVTISES